MWQARDTDIFILRFQINVAQALIIIHLDYNNYLLTGSLHLQSSMLLKYSSILLTEIKSNHVSFVLKTLSLLK